LWIWDNFFFHFLLSFHDIMVIIVCSVSFSSDSLFKFFVALDAILLVYWKTEFECLIWVLIIHSHLILVLGKRQIETWKNSSVDIQGFTQRLGRVCTNLWNSANKKQHLWDGFWPQLWALVHCKVAEASSNDWEWCF
jgi:hypothetical protein